MDFMQRYTWVPYCFSFLLLFILLFFLLFSPQYAVLPHGSHAKVCMGLFCHTSRFLLACLQVSFAIYVGLFCHICRSLSPCMQVSFAICADAALEVRACMRVWWLCVYLWRGRWVSVCECSWFTCV